MKEYYAEIMACPLFQGIAQPQLERMLSCLGARIIKTGKGRTVFSEGDSVDRIGILLRGSAQVLREDYNGDRSILSYVGPCELFGESYAFSGTKELPVNVVTNDTCVILVIDSVRVRSCCSNACQHHNQLIYNLLKIVSRKNLMLHQKIYITSRRTTREKLLAYLMHQAKVNKSNSFTIPYDRQELADYLEVDRSGLSSELGKLRKEGALECDRRKFKLLR